MRVFRKSYSCTEQGIELRIGYCMVYEEQERIIHFGPCAFSGIFLTTNKVDILNFQ